MQNDRRRQVLLLFTLIFWILFVLGGYYYYHKPINIQMIAAPLRALLDILFACLFAALAGGLGWRFFKAGAVPPLERAALQYALGAGILSLLWFILGILGLYRYPLGAPLLGLGLLLLWRDARAWYAQFGALKNAWHAAASLEKALALLTGVLILYQMFIALAPPTKWDALAYHLQLPRQYLAAGSLAFIPENPYWGHPQLVEMLYTFAMSFHRAETAALLSWSAGVIFLLGLLGLTNTSLARLKGEDEKEAGPSSNAGWIAVAAVSAGVTFRYLLGWSYTDLFSALFGLAALTVFFAWLDTHRPAWLLWAGLFCGLALGTKWTAGVLALGIFSAALVFRRQTGGVWKTWLLSGTIAFLTTLPWLVKNALVTGSPLYPYFFSTPALDAARMASANPPNAAVTWWMNLFLPVTSTWAGVDGAPGFSTDLGPLLLLLAVPGICLYRRSTYTKTIGLLLAFAALGLGVASLRNAHLMQTRLYFSVLPCLAIPAGWGWDWLQRQVIEGVRLRRIFSALLLLVLGLVAWQDTYFNGQITPGRVTLGTLTRQSYLENTLGNHLRAAQLLETLPPGARILLLWEPRGLYFPLNAQADLWIDRWRTDRRELKTAPAILDRWRSQGFTHVLFYQPGIELIRPQPGQPSSADWSVLQELLAMLPAPTPVGDLYHLYPLK